MTDNENTFSWDVKSERNGFGMTSKKNEDQDPDQDRKDHPAWSRFVQCYAPGTERTEGVEYLTTLQVMDRLNAIIDYEYYTEEKLVEKLTGSNFRVLLPLPNGLHLWMIRPL